MGFMGFHLKGNKENNGGINASLSVENDKFLGIWHRFLEDDHTKKAPFRDSPPAKGEIRFSTLWHVMEAS